MKIFNSLLISFIIAGCYIPTAEHGYSHMEEIDKDKVEQLEPGTTTKDDMRLLFGKPSENFTARKNYSLRTGIKTENTIFCYYWKRTDGYFPPYWVGWATEKSTEVEHAFCLEFMPDDKLKRFKHFERHWRYPKKIDYQIIDWANEEN